MTTDPRFMPRSAAVRRDVHHGRIWSAQPYRTIADDGANGELAYWPGLKSLSPATWSAARRSGDDSLRESGLEDLVTGHWQLESWTWQGTALLSCFHAGEYFSIHTFQDADTGEPQYWYVNFELPYTRTPIGWTPSTSSSTWSSNPTSAPTGGRTSTNMPRPVASA